MMLLNSISRSGIAALLSLAVLFSSPAHAQSSQIVSQFDDTTIAGLLKEVQADFEFEERPDGEKIYRVAGAGGLRFSVTARACQNDTGCAGLLMIAVFTRNDDRSFAELDSFLNEYNDLNPNAKVYRVANGTVVLQGYINAAGAISTQNAKFQLLVFAQEITKLREKLTEFAKPE